jgi:hypothetical protein
LAAAEGHATDGEWYPEAADGRLAFFHEWAHGDWKLSYLTCLHELRVGPGVERYAAWHYVGSTPSPELSAAERAAQLRIGRRLDESLRTLAAATGE